MKKRHTPQERAGNRNFRLRLRAPEGNNPPTGNVISGENAKKGRETPSRDLWSLAVAMEVVLLYYIINRPAAHADTTTSGSGRVSSGDVTSDRVTDITSGQGWAHEFR
jgi:hypothetical protein